MLPDYLKKHNHEIVVVNGQPKLVKIELVDFSLEAWPKEIILKLVEEAGKDAKAVAIMDQMKIPQAEQFKMFIGCRYGGFDQQADIAETLTPDFTDCPLRGQCPGEGKICLNVQCDNGVLTRRELEYAQLVSKDLLDKQIADRMGVSLNTINTYRKSVENKIGVSSKAGVVAFIVKKNLL